MRVVVVQSDAALPVRTAEALREVGWEVASFSDLDGARTALSAGAADAVVLGIPDSAVELPAPPPSPTGPRRGYEQLIRFINAERIPAVLVGPSAAPHPAHHSLIDHAPRSADAADVASRLSTVMRYHALVQRMEAELDNMQRLGKRLNQHFSEVDQEMRLAGRLQRDFLPRLSMPIAGVTFETIYRPALWVSGDIYDIFRVDEHHVAFFVADAVGHGMAASLLTMFIKQAVIPKRIEGDAYRVLDPSEVLVHLNDVLVEQGLPNCQFVTACYALLDTRTLELRFSRGGHPYPVLIGADGSAVELKATGGLLGLFPREEYPSNQVQLGPKDKVLIFTDGIELALPAPTPVTPLAPLATAPTGSAGSPLHSPAGRGAGREGHPRHPLAAIEGLCSLPLKEILRRVEERLDAQAGSLDPRDDVTLVGMEIAAAPGGPASARSPGSPAKAAARSGLHDVSNVVVGAPCRRQQAST